MKESNTNLITALYCRLSVEDMRMGESMSIENQRLMLTEFAEKNGFKNLKLYIDDGYSGTDNTRPQYTQMMNDVYEGLVGAVIVKDQSRLGRDHLETDRLMELVFPSYDVRFIAITDNVDSANGFNDMSTMRNWFNDFYARDCSKKIRAVKRAKGERGERVSATIPYGYIKDSDNPKQIIPDPETAPIVRRIYDMSLKGLGITKIGDILCSEKVICPTAYAFKKWGKLHPGLNTDRPYHWAQETIRYILSNRIYCGDTVNFKTYSKSNKLKKRIKNAPEDVMIFKDTHEAIVDRKTFEIVQKHFEGRKRPNRSGIVDKFAGYLFCGECGSRLYLRQGGETTASHYTCSGHSKRVTDCSAHYIRAKILDEIVLTALKQVTVFAREHAEEFYNKITANGEAEAKKRLKESERLKISYITRLNQLDNIIKTLYEDRAIGRITPERYDQLAEGYESEQTDIKAKLAALESDIDTAKLREKCVEEFISKSKQYIEMPELTPELLRVFIKRIDVWEKEIKYSRTCGNRIDITFTFEPDKAVEIKGICMELLEVKSS